MRSFTLILPYLITLTTGLHTLLNSFYFEAKQKSSTEKYFELKKRINKTL